MLKRQLLFFAILAAPVVAFSVRRPAFLGILAVSLVGAWWAASPVSYPRWVGHGMARALPLGALEALALWWLTR